MANLLQGKLGVITGGGSGIGRAICQRLAAQGARLIVVDRHEESASSTVSQLEGQGHKSFAGDVSKSADVENLRKFAVDHLKGAPNVVVNCAGITRDATLLKMSEQAFDDVVAVNLKGVHLVTQAFAREAVANQALLSVINVSSIIGKVGNFGQTNYAATKAGVIAFSKSAAKELAKKGIRVNAVLPGFVETPMTTAMPPDVLKSICAGIPMGRMGHADEIANGVLYLASDLSSYVTGAQLEITGGLYM
ncbi:unnamed protein product, partial [Mesorhabditis belari]|uniref:(3R)-3-hydroxyacyl-CoA dehydrogenase n=1 Tax=Mesorhabditis belari TaxID=2138241 RepID=A0AAF3J497_9BILA